MSRTPLTEVGTCTACRRRVFHGPDGAEVVKVRRTSIEPHHHRPDKPYELVPDRIDDDHDREWWWAAGYRRL